MSERGLTVMGHLRHCDPIGIEKLYKVGMNDVSFTTGQSNEEFWDVV